MCVLVIAWMCFVVYSCVCLCVRCFVLCVCAFSLFVRVVCSYCFVCLLLLLEVFVYIINVYINCFFVFV